MKAWLIICCLYLGTIASHSSINWTVNGQLKNGKLLTSITQTLPDGWHSYWKNPGDSGDGARITILSEGVLADELKFPKPMVIPVDPLITYGYEGTIIYTLALKLTQPHKIISATFDWLECSELCIPKSTTLKLNIPKSPPLITPPQPYNEQIEIIKKGQHIYFKLPTNIVSAEFYPYQNNQFNLKKMRFKNHDLSLPLIDKSLTKVNGELFLNDDPPIVIKALPTLVKSQFMPLILTLITAFIGGLLLNIMPCVLPIIGIKALQLKQVPSSSKKSDAIFYATGILTSLFLLYAILLGLKQTGASIGWGFQLQSPVMIQLLILLFIGIMAINTNLIQIPLPKFAAKSSNNMLLNGMFTTIIATPCTAPFLGAALSVALFQNPGFGALIFLCIGSGLSLPMVALILNPNLSRLLPTSGRWNERIKYSLNFGFIASIGWLMWILNAQTEIAGLFFASAITLFCILVFKAKVPLIKPLFLILCTVIIGIIPLIALPNTTSKWVAYSHDLITELERKNQPYFIDITAKWCVTCQTNKLTVLNQSKALSMFKEKNITLISADWTNKSDAITMLLTRFKQISIPTYIYFDGTEHRVFGDILTPKKLKENLK
tara:strand:+ start:215 stop:2029 length:1815 start_codon:yes stop_codon:yes gene_type:complete